MTSENLGLVRFDKMRQAIIEAKSVDEVKDIIDKTDALRIYTRQAGMALESQNQVAEIGLRAKRRGGELLAKMERAQGARTDITSVQPGPKFADQIKEAGISHRKAIDWQRIAKIPENKFEEQIEKTKEADRELTTAGMVRLAKTIERESRREAIIAQPSDSSPDLWIAKAEAMPLDDNSVDVIITSPPYNLGAESWPMGGAGRIPRDGGIGYQDAQDEGVYQTWQLECLREMYRVAKTGASLFYNHKVRSCDGIMLHPLMWLFDDSNPWILRQEIIWDRGSTHNHSPTLFWPHDERIYWMTKGKPTLPERPIGMPTVWAFHGPVAGTWHPAPFSEDLPRMCLEAIGREGITVLDPFAGSCTTMKVALSFGYSAIGIDKDEEYLTRAAKENGWISPSRA